MKGRPIRLPAPYLKRVWLDQSRVPDATAYPFCLPFLHNGFELDFDRAITVIVGENGTGKSTLLEGIAALAGYDEAGGGKGYRPVDHSRALEVMGGSLAQALRASWPKITNGWFFRAESFFSVARYLDTAALDAGAQAPDFLSHSYGEGFLRFFDERCKRQGTLDAGVLRRSGIVHRHGFERLILGCHARHACAYLSRRGSIRLILVPTKNDRRVHLRRQGRVQ
jgi:energy-coupling factor transporter ATP-binding protein EcfA2